MLNSMGPYQIKKIVIRMNEYFELGLLQKVLSKKENHCINSVLKNGIEKDPLSILNTKYNGKGNSFTNDNPHSWIPISLFL